MYKYKSKHIFSNNYFLLNKNYIERSLSGEYDLMEEEKQYVFT